MDIVQDSLRKQVHSIYTPLKIVQKEIWKRWNDKALREEVLSYTGSKIPIVFDDAPKAILSRHVLSPNFEAIEFERLSRKSGLAPVCLEYISDKFVTGNPDKLFLAKLTFFEGIDERGSKKTTNYKLIDLVKSDGKIFSDIRTLSSGDFLSFHHDMCKKYLPQIQFCDISEYYYDHGKIAEKYYSFYLSLFICFGVLFENYPINYTYTVFTRDVLLPSYEKVFSLFGLKPLIVKLSPFSRESDIYWRWYPQEISNFVI